MARRVQPCVVYVRFPGTPNREYCYHCNFPIEVGDSVIANGTLVTVHRKAAFDTIASKSVQRAPSESERRNKARMREIAERLQVIEQQEAKLDRWSKLKSPEARKLVAELRRLNK